MNRKGFVAALLGFTSLPLFGQSSGQRLKKRKNRGFKISAGEGRLHGHLVLKGVNSNILDVKVSGQDTDGDLAIFVQTSLSPGRGTPLHIHHAQDEIFYVLEGEYYFQVGEEKHHLTTGDSIFLPRKVPHAWTQSSARGSMVVTVQPAGELENFFVTLAGLEKGPDPEDLKKIFAANGMEVVGPPLELE